MREVRRRTDGGYAASRGRGVRCPGRAGLPPGARGAEARGGLRRHPSLLREGEFQRRGCRHGGCDLSGGADPAALQYPTDAGFDGAGVRYAASGRWPFPYAPHDIGTYPLAYGAQYWGGDITSGLSRAEMDKITVDQMPVEESADMIILVAALYQAEGKTDYALKYWPLLTKWAEYLKAKGLDPENQLCTDDFTGHLAHNTNLSVKAILGLGSYAMLCDRVGKKEEAASYRHTAEEYARQWVKMADDGDHYRLAFDKPGTWSQKYNLVWDRVLGLNLFPAEVTRKELAYYQQRQNHFGLPLDNRKEYTKLDWSLWTATLADSPAEFHIFIAPIYDWINGTPTRVPLTDWYETTDGKQDGFQARSVVGGIFIKMLADAPTWKKWSSRTD